MNNITVVSGYWEVHNKYGNKYNEWFNNSLRINQRYIFFCENSDYILNYRKDLETIFVNHPINNFISYNIYKDNWIHPIHVPSKELGMIWHEKINCLK